MPSLSHRLFLLTGCLTTLVGTTVAAPEWTQLKTGMTSEEAFKQLGEPLIRTNKRGYELWIYDGRGEVLFEGGPLKAWTVGHPTAESASRPIAQDVLIKPRPRFRLPPLQALPQNQLPPEPTVTRFRYQQ